MSLDSSSVMEVDNDDVATSRTSTSSSTSSSSSQSTASCKAYSSHGGDAPRPTSAPLNSRNFGSGVHPPRAIRTAPTQPNNKSNNSNDQNVRVVARLRPLSTKEIDEKSKESILAHSQTSTIRVNSSEDHTNNGSSGIDSNSNRKFEFDAVFAPASTQQEVYENACGDMISSSIFKGFNATILAYGQTGSGKTFTMGTDGSSGGSAGSPNSSGDNSMAPPSPSEGVIGRAVYDLFRTKHSLPNGSERVKVNMSYLEIYNEQAIDLLNDDHPSSSNPTHLQVRDSKTEGVVIPNLKHFPVSSPEEVRLLMEKASMKRATASTHMNAVSSRSHAICTLIVTIAPDLDSSTISATTADEENVGDSMISPRSASQGMRAKLTLVDLAGSERLKRTGAEGARMKEGININKGLFTLGQVVSALSDLGQRSHGSSQHGHIPYRDSKLTRLLQDSLGGNSRTLMIACISPADSNVEEGINTLRYAERTRNIKNSAVKNVVSSGLSASEAAALRRENQQLKLELARMESKMIVSSNGCAGAGFSFAVGDLVSTSKNNMDAVGPLQAQCSSLLAEIALLKESAQNQAKEVLEASLRADKWQAKSEAISKLAIEQGVTLSEEMEDNSSDIIGISQLRNQLAEYKAELLEARTEAVVARAAAGAVIAGNGDLSNIEETISMTSEDASIMASPEKEDQAQNNEQLTTELSEVSATIEQKEEMVSQMNKERACMDNLQLHFENSLRSLQAEVDALTSERDELMLKMSNNDKENNPNAKLRHKRKANDPISKRLREQISKLELRINEFKLKASDHKKSLKMKEEAQKRCARLTAEIAEDKRRRADLQRKLKETSVEMRAEKRAAQHKAARMMKDSQKLKIELTKMKSVAQKQAAVLKRKIDQASSKEKARAELERKRRSAERMRLTSSSMDNSDVKEGRKIELASWIDRELEFSLIKFQIDEQRRQLDNAVSESKKLMKNSGDTDDVEGLNQMDTIRSLRATVQDLEIAAKKAFPTAADNMTSNYRFLEMGTFKGLSRLDSKYVLSYIFDACSSAKQETATMISDQQVTTKANIDSVLAKEQHLHEKELREVKMEHAQVKLYLLESTQRTLNSDIKIKMDTDLTEEGLKAQVDCILGTYNESWTSAAKGLKADLEVIKETQEDLQTMMDNMTKGVTFVPKKHKAKKVVEYDSEAFESEHSFVDEGDGEDSEYEPTPAKDKRKRRSPRLAKKATDPGSPASPIGENFIGDLDKKRVGSLKKACKKLGIPMTGKKADLKQRVRETILNSSLAILNCSVAEGNDESFSIGSALKKVNFEVGVAMDPEFQPIAENTTSTESIKKQLWQYETDDVLNVAKPKSSAAPPKSTSKTSFRINKQLWQQETDDLLDVAKPKSSAAPPKSTSKTSSHLTPGKRKESPSSEKENINSATPKRQRPFGFMTSSPRRLSQKAKSRTPVHQKQTIATLKKRLVPDAKRSVSVKKINITASTKKRNKRGMANAVALALKQTSDLF